MAVLLLVLRSYFFLVFREKYVKNESSVLSTPADCFEERALRRRISEASSLRVRSSLFARFSRILLVSASISRVIEDFVIVSSGRKLSGLRKICRCPPECRCLRSLREERDGCRSRI